MVTRQFHLERLPTGKAKTAPQTLPDLVRPGSTPVTVLAVDEPGLILEIGPHDEPPRAALRAHEFVGPFELSDWTNVSASEMVYQPSAGNAAGTTTTAARPKRR
jgi:hypothetical protein